MASQPIDRRRKGAAPKNSSKHPIELFSDDPEVKLINGFVNGMHHISERDLTIRHLKLIMTVYLIGRAYNGTKPNRAMIAAVSRVPEKQLEPELSELVDKRYLVEVTPLMGDLKKTSFKLGSMGGTMMRHVLGPNQKPGNDIPG